MTTRQGLILATVLATAAIARAQPPPTDSPDTRPLTSPLGPPLTPPLGPPIHPMPPADPGTPTEIGSDGTDDAPRPGSSPGAPESPYVPEGLPPDVGAPTIPELPRKKVRRGPIDMPEVLSTPTGWLLPAAVVYSRTSLDTGGGLSSDMRVGLGDVAEFGIATTDAVRERLHDADPHATRIQPYVTASFRLGVSEGLLFDTQPGVTLGFRKSFERVHDGFTTRIAELTLVASKHIGKRVAIHMGGAFWDASLEGDLDGVDGSPRTLALHDGLMREQIRAFGGIQVEPLPRSQILVDLGWSPEFCYGCVRDDDKIKLRPTLAWGVRYAVADFMNLEAGVRVPDIGDLNLLDAQIFGQVTFVSWALRRAVESLR